MKFSKKLFSLIFASIMLCASAGTTKAMQAKTYKILVLTEDTFADFEPTTQVVVSKLRTRLKNYRLQEVGIDEKRADLLFIVLNEGRLGTIHFPYNLRHARRTLLPQIRSSQHKFILQVAPLYVSTTLDSTPYIMGISRNLSYSESVHLLEERYSFMVERFKYDNDQNQFYRYLDKISENEAFAGLDRQLKRFAPCPSSGPGAACPPCRPARRRTKKQDRDAVLATGLSYELVSRLSPRKRNKIIRSCTTRSVPRKRHLSRDVQSKMIDIREQIALLATIFSKEMQSLQTELTCTSLNLHTDDELSTKIETIMEQMKTAREMFAEKMKELERKLAALKRS